MRKLLSLTIMALATSTAFAGGYRVSLQGQKQLAMGHTGVAVVNSAEVLFFNPAGASFLKDRFNFSAGGNGLFARTKFQDEQFNQHASTDNFGTPFEIYASYRATDWLTVGLAVYTPYGSAVKWDRDWQGSNLVNNIDLEAVYIQPTVSIKVNDKFSIGGGPIYVNGNVEFNRNIDKSTTDEAGNRTDLTIKATGVTAWGYTAGFMFNPTDKIRLGVNYRSDITMKARNGNATFHDVPAYLANNPAYPTDPTAIQLGNTKFNANLPLPAEITAGLSVQITSKWLVAFDYNRAFWHVYDALVVDFKQTSTSNVPQSYNARNYKDASTYRIGTQFKPNDKFAFRAGWYFDQSPVQKGYFAPETPRNDSMGFTGGLTYQLTPKFGIDASFLYLHFDQIKASYDHYATANNSNISFAGTYKNVVFSPGVGVTYSF